MDINEALLRMLSRKFLLVVAALFAATGLLLHGSITAELWGDITKYLIAAYVVGNVSATVANKVKPS